MTTIYCIIHCTRYGLEITTYKPHQLIGDRVHYIGYNRRAALATHRKKFDLKYKRLTIVEV